jgi:hypothetical protein
MRRFRMLKFAIKLISRERRRGKGLKTRTSMLMQPYSNAAVSCLDKPERDEVATQVIANKVTLDIDASLGLLDEPEAQTERVDAELQPVDAA